MTTILARFVVLCCAADAVAYTVEVDLPDGVPVPPSDAWLSVSGQLKRSEDGDLIVRATEARRTVEPDDPYVSAAR